MTDSMTQVEDRFNNPALLMEHSGQAIAAATHVCSSMWNVRDILQPVLPCIKDAVKEIVPYLEVKPDSLHTALRELAVRDEYTCHLRGVEQPAEDSRRYHGTSWQGLKQILKRGLLPTYGAGRS